LYAKTFNNSGSVTASAGSTLSFGNTGAYNSFNTGTVTATGAGTIVYIAGNVANTGTGILRAQSSGVLRFTGTNTTGNLGTVDITGGFAQFNGTLNNTSATLTAPTGGRYDLLGGTITGGTVAGNALALTTSSGTLNGVSITGNLSIPVN